VPLQRLFTEFDALTLGDHEYTNGAVPLPTVIVAVPVHCEKQFGLVDDVRDKVGVGVCVIVTTLFMDVPQVAFDMVQV
jgi:hypothetical protein